MVNDFVKYLVKEAKNIHKDKDVLDAFKLTSLLFVGVIVFIFGGFINNIFLLIFGFVWFVVGIVLLMVWIMWDGEV